MARPRLGLLIVPLFVGSIALVCVLVARCGEEQTSVSSSTSAAVTVPASSPVASASAGPAMVVPLLEGLKPGDTVDEWTVSRLFVNTSIEKKPQLAVELERKGSGITIWIARVSDAKNPPVRTAKYALSFGDARPYGEPIPDDAATKVTNLLAERVRRTEATVDPPAGL